MEHETDDGNIVFWVDEFDLSTLTYEQFTAFFFDRPIIPYDDNWASALSDLFRGRFDGFMAWNPPSVVRNMLRTFQNWGELAKIYSYEQMEQGGTFGMLDHPVKCNKYLFDDQVPLALRVECIEAMYFVFATFKSDPLRPANIRDDSTMDDYFMWWDQVLSDFWMFADRWKGGWAGTPKELRDYAGLNDDLRQIVDACFRTLVRILNLDHRYCQACALHGLGHSKHPLVRETVQKYIDQHKNALTAPEIEYAMSARECRVL